MASWVRREARAKRLGKNNLAFFSQADYEQRLSTIELQEELQSSVQQGFRGFHLCYQPQFRSRTYQLFGAEALLRYTSPTRGAVSPSEFIPILEQSGLICPVGLWVLERALNQPTQDEAYKKGVEMTMTQLVKIFTELGVEIFGEPGDAFDPNLHNAVMHTQQEDTPENTITQVFQKGFRMGDKIVRFAMVQVAN